MRKDNSETKEITRTSMKTTRTYITTNSSNINRKKGKFTDACLKSITLMDGSFRDSQQEITNIVRQTTLIQKILKGFLTIFGKEDDEIKVSDNQEFIKIANNKATQSRFSESIQEKIHSLASGSSN